MEVNQNWFTYRGKGKEQVLEHADFFLALIAQEGEDKQTCQLRPFKMCPKLYLCSFHPSLFLPYLSCLTGTLLSLHEWLKGTVSVKFLF